MIQKVRLKVSILFAFLILSIFGQILYSQEVIYDETGCMYTSYDGLVMCGYQGWFATPGDPLRAGWFHYSRDGQVRPGYIGIDCWPDMKEYMHKYGVLGFRHPDFSQAYLYSNQDEETVDLHFKWMKEYGIDGVFVQRFVSQTREGIAKTRVNNVLEYALKAAKKYERAICIMYDGGIDNEDQYNQIKNDWNEIVETYKLFDPEENPTFLRHNGKPVFSLWGYGIDSRGYDPFWFDQLCEAIKGTVAKKVSVMIGTPYYWREQGGDCVKEDTYLPSLRKWCDIISPWAVGRYSNNNTISKVETYVEADIVWCKENNIDYVPVAFPGFSWANMFALTKPYDEIPRMRGKFLWDQIAAAKRSGADKLYIAMFDEMDEATCIFKCETKSNIPGNGEGTFIGYDDDLGSDYYLWLTGEAAKWFQGEDGYTENQPERPPSTSIPYVDYNTSWNIYVQNQQLVIENPDGNIFSIRLYSSAGKLVRYSHNMTVAKQIISLNQLNKGIYIVEVKSGKDTFSRKIEIK